MSAKKPTFDSLWRNFPKGKTASEVYRIVGGQPLFNHLTNPIGYANACAMRMSYALNHAGYFIPHQPGVTMGSAYYDMHGRPNLQPSMPESDKAKYPDRFRKCWHFYLVIDMVRYIRNMYGSPDINTVGTSDRTPFLRKRGIIFFKVADWNDAQGHITLFDGTNCIDNDDEFSHIDSKSEFVSLWQL